MAIHIPVLLALKGITFITKSIIAAKKTTVAAKAVSLAVHKYGAAKVFSSVVFVSGTVGGILWTSDMFEDVGSMYSSWENNEKEECFRKFGSLLSKVSTLGITEESLVKSIEQMMNNHGLEKTLNVNGFIKNLYDLINEFIKTAKS